LFGDDQENAHEAMKIHKQFTELMETLLTENLEELGVGLEDFVKAVDRYTHVHRRLHCFLNVVDSFRAKQSNHMSSLMLEQILAVEDFLSILYCFSDYFAELTCLFFSSFQKNDDQAKPRIGERGARVNSAAFS